MEILLKMEEFLSQNVFFNGMSIKTNVFTESNAISP